MNHIKVVSRLTNSNISTIVDILHWRSQTQPKKITCRFLSGDIGEKTMDYYTLDYRARLIAAALQEMNMVGERVLLVFVPGLEYITAFYGCLYAGAIAVPTYPPKPNQTIERINKIVADCDAKLALTTTQIFSRIEANQSNDSFIKNLKWLITTNIDPMIADQWKQANIDEHSIALLQYTSGSTGEPKGVMVTHNNLLHNMKAIHDCFENHSDCCALLWLRVCQEFCAFSQ